MNNDTLHLAGDIIRDQKKIMQRWRTAFFISTAALIGTLAYMICKFV